MAKINKRNPITLPRSNGGNFYSLLAPGSFSSWSGNTMTLNRPTSNNTAGSLTSKSSFMSGIIIAQADLNWTAGGGTNEDIGGIKLTNGSASAGAEHTVTSNASISSRSDSGNTYRCNAGSSSWNSYQLSTAITKGKTVKIVYNQSTNAISFWYWSGSAWGQMGTTQTYDIKGTGSVSMRLYYTALSTSLGALTFNNVYFNTYASDYSTQYPVSGIALADNPSGLVFEALLNGNVLDTNDLDKTTLTPTSITYADCPVGYQKKCGVFNGSSSKVSGNAANIVGAMSFVINIYCNSNAARGGIISRTNEGGNGNNDQFVFEQGGSSGELRFWTRNTGGTYCMASVTGETIQSVWSHIYGEFDGTYVRLYKGNKLLATSAAFSGTQMTGSTLSLGREGENHFFNGLLAGARVFNRTLTENERLAYWHEFNRNLAGGSDFGAVIPAPTAYLEAVGEDTFYDVQLGTKATRTAGTVANDAFGISKAISGPNQAWTSVSGDSFVFWDNSGWKLEKNNAAVTATGVNTANTVRAVLYYPAGTISASQQTYLENCFKSGYPYPFRRYVPESIKPFAYYDGSFSGSSAYDVIGGIGTKPIVGTMQSSVRFGQNKSFITSSSQAINFGTTNFYDAGGWWIGQWVNTDSTSLVENDFNSSNGYWFRLQYNNTSGKAGAYFYDGTARVADSVKTVNDSTTHFCIAEFLPGSYARIWVDGVIEKTISVGAAAWLGSQEGQFAFSSRDGAVYLRGNADFMYGKGVLDESKVHALMYATYRQ